MVRRIMDNGRRERYMVKGSLDMAIISIKGFGRMGRGLSGLIKWHKMTNAIKFSFSYMFLSKKIRIGLSKMKI